MSFNEDKEIFLEELKEKKDLDEQARLAALEKLKQQGLGQQLISKESQSDGLSLNKRKYGPYELTTTLDTAHDPVYGEKRGQLINEVKFRGEQHSPSDIKKLADDLKQPGKPTDYKKFENIIKQLRPDTPEDPNSYIDAQDRIKSGPSNKPLWYNEDEE